ncbi:hypothetical protein DSO57_1036655 [Entomophthora muscae]|uniref:Uncharacterized protein n=1 Tax=Entomophthora muscae TaxID=34485 RepID=A0ACC2RDU8_9FUNG|nr:hypothetical protein DSO57_1036655 [Entomophthora muscae]
MYVIGSNLLVEREIAREYGLDDGLQLGTGVQWFGSGNLTTGRRILGLPLPPFIPLNLKIDQEKIGIRAPRRVSEMLICTAGKTTVLESHPVYATPWRITGNFNKEISFWEKQFYGLVPKEFMDLLKPITLKLEVNPPKSTVEYIWHREVYYRITGTVTHLFDNSKWYFEAIFPFVTRDGQPAVIYGLEDACSVQFDNHSKSEVEDIANIQNGFCSE